MPKFLVTFKITVDAEDAEEAEEIAGWNIKNADCTDVEEVYF